MKQKTVEIMEEVSGTIRLPSDILAGASIMTVMGQRQICIENYKGIIEYTDELVRVQTKTGRIQIEGKRLMIAYYTVDEMKITGYIKMIQFCE